MYGQMISFAGPLSIPRIPPLTALILCIILAYAYPVLGIPNLGFFEIDSNSQGLSTYQARTGEIEVTITTDNVTLSSHGQLSSLWKLELDIGDSSTQRAYRISPLGDPGKLNIYHGRSNSDWIEGIPFCKELVIRDPATNDRLEISLTSCGLEYRRISSSSSMLSHSIPISISHTSGLSELGYSTFESLDGSTALCCDLSSMARGSIEIDYNSAEQSSIFKDRPLRSDEDRLEWSTYFGGENNDSGSQILLRSDGSIIIAGSTSGGDDFPISDNPYEDEHSGYQDLFIARISDTAESVIWCTYLGGSLTEDVRDIDFLPGSNDVLLAGFTTSTDFPLQYAFDDSLASLDHDGFISVLSDDGGTLKMSSYLGGEDDDYVEDVAFDDTAIAYVCGHTYSDDNIATSGSFMDTQASPAYYYGFVMRFRTDTQPWTKHWGSYIGPEDYEGQGNPATLIKAITVDGNGDAYITGYTSATSFPTTSGAYDETHNDSPSGNNEMDVVAARIDSTGTDLIWASYLGGTHNDAGADIALTNGDSLLIVLGYTKSDSFPLEGDIYSDDFSGNNADVFITAFHADDGSALEYSTVIGGLSDDYGHNMCAYDNCIYVGGYASDVGGNYFPTTTDAFQSEPIDDSEGIAFCFSPSSGYVYGTFIGGSSFDRVFGIAADSDGGIYLIGSTYSSDFPATRGVFSEDLIGDEDAFLLKLNREMPGRVSSFVATPGHKYISLSWEDPSQADLDSIEIWRGPWDDDSEDIGDTAYPRFAMDSLNVVPERSRFRSEVISDDNWEHVFTIAAGVESYVDSLDVQTQLDDRGIWFYEAYALDTDGYYGLPYEDDDVRATNYYVADLDNDGDVDIADQAIFAPSYQKSYGDAGYSAECDWIGGTRDPFLNIPLPNDSVNVADFAILAQNKNHIPPAPRSQQGSEYAELRWILLADGAYSLQLISPCNDLAALSIASVDLDSEGTKWNWGSLIEQQPASCTTIAANDGNFGVAVASSGRGSSLIGVGEILRLRILSDLSVEALSIQAIDSNIMPIPIRLDGESNEESAMHFHMAQVFPNPFNPSTEINFSLPIQSHARLGIYSVTGRLLSLLVDKELDVGKHSVLWNGCDSSGSQLASGMYFARLTAGPYTDQKKMILVK